MLDHGLLTFRHAWKETLYNKGKIRETLYHFVCIHIWKKWCAIWIMNTENYMCLKYILDDFCFLKIFPETPKILQLRFQGGLKCKFAGINLFTPAPQTNTSLKKVEASYTERIQMCKNLSMWLEQRKALQIAPLCEIWPELGSPFRGRAPSPCVNVRACLKTDQEWTS